MHYTAYFSMRHYAGFLHIRSQMCMTPLTDKSISAPMQKDNEHDEYAVNNGLYQSTKGTCTHQERY